MAQVTFEPLFELGAASASKVKENQKLTAHDASLWASEYSVHSQVGMDEIRVWLAVCSHNRDEFARLRLRPGGRHLR
jgi:hypothetical protein